MRTRGIAYVNQVKSTTSRNEDVSMHRILPVFISLLLIVTGCATIRLEYRADVELADGEEAEATYARSYDTTGHMIGCIITGVIYGGWCWAYALMPFASQD